MPRGILPRRIKPVKKCESCKGSGVRKVLRYKGGIFSSAEAPCLCLWFKDKVVRAEIRETFDAPLRKIYREYLKESERLEAAAAKRALQAA